MLNISDTLFKSSCSVPFDTLRECTRLYKLLVSIQAKCKALSEVHGICSGHSYSRSSVKKPSFEEKTRFQSSAIFKQALKNGNLITCAYQVGGTQESATHQRVTYLQLIP